MRLFIVLAFVALASGLPTSPMESVSSGLVAMINGQSKATRSAGLPVVPVLQSTPVPLVQDHLASTVHPVVSSPSSSMMISSTLPPPVPIGSSGGSPIAPSSRQLFGIPFPGKKSPNNKEQSLADDSTCCSAASSNQGVALPPVNGPPPFLNSQEKQGGLFPSQITSLPGALASQMQGQMSSLQQQVTQVGGSLISQTQDQMSSLQSQMASIPSALGSLVPSGLVPQRAPVSTVSPSIVSTIVPVPAVVTSPPSVLPVSSQLPITVQSQ